VSGSIPRIRGVDASVRVRGDDLDRLAGVVHELMLTQSMIARDPALRGAYTPDLGRKLAHAARLVEELEAVAGELRTVEFSATTQKLVRAARDTAHQCDKSVELETTGEATLVERAIAEVVCDALLQMVRNAIVHGIEPEDERLLAGKPASGRLRIAVARTEAELVIEIADDGRGLDAAALRREAVERGLVSRDEVLSESDAFALIFRPGFSTARTVTDLAGRGVGMDIVRANVDGLAGTIEIASRVGQGTAFTIRLPHRPQPEHATFTFPMSPCQSRSLVPAV
jgi:two-component system chemotaxis sensor kinase CheA